MNWFNVIKNPKLRAGSKITTNLSSESKPQKDDCERKIREYANKLEKIYEITTDDVRISATGAVHSGKGSHPVISEKVYCKALKLLNQLTFASTDYSKYKEEKFEDEYGNKVRIAGVYREQPQFTRFGIILMVLVVTYNETHTTLRLQKSITFSNRDKMEEYIKEVDFR
jgi:hypothetical protein